MRPSALPCIDTCNFYKLNFFFPSTWRMAVSKGLKIFKVNTKLPGHSKKHYQNSKCKLVERVILPDSVHWDEVCRGEQP